MFVFDCHLENTLIQVILGQILTLYRRTSRSAIFNLMI